MQERLERLVEVIYKRWRREQEVSEEPHPEDEDFACFFEGRLSADEQRRIEGHILRCKRCAEAVAAQIMLEEGQAKEIPFELADWARNLVGSKDSSCVLEIFLKLKEQILEIVNTNGDVLVGRELVPAPILRSRKIKEFKDQVTILKDFEGVRVEIKIENKGRNLFSLMILIKEKRRQKVLKDLRATLIKDELELESYITDSGSVIFENVSLGRYKVEISSPTRKIASLLLDLRI